MNPLPKKFYCLGLLAGFCALMLPACREQQKVIEEDIRDVMLHNRHSYFYIDTGHYPVKDKALPIGVFDSGTGGLTILDALVTLDHFNNQTHEYVAEGDGIPDFASESFIYLGDQANMPYGNYPAENNTALLMEHIFKDVQFLLGTRYYRTQQASSFSNDKKPVKSIVIACNTATAFGKKAIDTFMVTSGLNLPVTGVIDAGVKAALKFLNPDEPAGVAIMATAGTVASGGYVNTLNEQLKQARFHAEVQAFQQAGIGLAGAIDGAPEFIAPDAQKPREEYKGPSEDNRDAPLDTTILERYGFDWDNHRMLFQGSLSQPENIQINSIENYISYHLVTLLEKIRKTPQAKPLKVIILGCTHYPFYQAFFRKKLDWLYNLKEDGAFVYRAVMDPKIRLVDPAVFTAEELYTILNEKDLHREGTHLQESEFYISVPNPLNPEVQTDTSGGFTYYYKYGRKPGYIQEYVRRVPFSRANIPEEVLMRFRKIIPDTYILLESFSRNSSKTKEIPEKERI